MNKTRKLLSLLMAVVLAFTMMSFTFTVAAEEEGCPGGCYNVVISSHQHFVNSTLGCGCKQYLDFDVMLCLTCHDSWGANHVYSWIYCSTHCNHSLVETTLNYNQVNLNCGCILYFRLYEIRCTKGCGYYNIYNTQIDFHKGDNCPGNH